MRGRKRKPNILFILSDDHGYWALGSYGNQEIRTPNLDRLAASGMRFENFFCTSPVCSPARASLLTGQIPSRHGVHDWLSAGNTRSRKLEPLGKGRLIRYLEGQPGYTDYLAEAGYYCGLSGKWHLGDSHHPQKGFEFWRVHAKGGGPYYGAPMIHDGRLYNAPGYVTDVITDHALEFLDLAAERQSPFYLSVCYTAPHSPWGREEHPAAAYDAYYEGCAFQSVPDKVAAPAWVQRRNIPVDDEKTRRSYLSGYYAAITEMDRNIGRIIDWLEAHGQREQTLVIFMSDNGMNMGQHGLYGKGNATFPLNMFEESVKVPCLFSHPGHIPTGRVNRCLLSQYDIFPTLLDYAGVDHSAPDSMPGRSFAASLRQPRSRNHDFVVVYDEYGPVRMIRSTRWKYVHRYAYGPHELYDLKNDPLETDNLAGRPECRRKERELRGLLGEWFLRHADPARDGIHESVTGAGQYGLCGALGGGNNNFSSLD